MAVAYVSDVEGVWSSGTTLTLASVGGSGGSVVVLFVSWRNNAAQTVSGVTYGGNAMTKIGSTINSGGGGPLEAYYYITSSDGDAVVTFSAAPANAQATALVFSGAHATTPIGTAQTSGAADGSVPYETSSAAVTSETDGLCVDGFALRGDSTGLTIGADQTQRSAQNASSSLFHRTSTKAGAASVTMSWSWATNALHYAHIVLPIAPAEASGEVAGTPFQNLHNCFGPALAARMNGVIQ